MTDSVLQFTIRRAMVVIALLAVYLALALAPNNRIGSVRMLLMLPMLMICYVSILGSSDFLNSSPLVEKGTSRSVINSRSNARRL